MAAPIDQEAIDTLFTNARSVRKWRDEAVPESVIRRLFDLTVLGPTSGNCCPSRFVFVTSTSEKERIVPHLASNNVEPTRTSPLTVIIATDTRFWEAMEPGAKMTKVMSQMAPEAQWDNGFRNGTLQGGYLILAARALGLDCGAMSGFDKAGVDAEFFPDGRLASNFLCNIGYGDYTDIAPRPPRPAFEDVCSIL